jgi:sigma-B regulation protein RsbU (phosphoserine phosphatase)
MKAAAEKPASTPRAGLLEILLGVALVVYGLAQWGGLGPAARFIALAAVLSLGVAVAVRWMSYGVRLLIWSLRNRLVVAYLFIAVLPLVLVLILVELTTWALAGQIGAFLLNAEMERRVAPLRAVAQSLTKVPPQTRIEAIRRAGFIFHDRFPGMEILVHDTDHGDMRFPDSSTLTPPPAGLGDVSGIVVKDGFFYVWAHTGADNGDVVITTPVTRAFLHGLVPGLGNVTLRGFREPDDASDPPPMHVHPPIPDEEPQNAADASNTEPPAQNQLDLKVLWGVRMPVRLWDSPAKERRAILGMRTRVSSVLQILFSHKTEGDQQDLLRYLYLFAFTFLVVQFIAVIIGISLTRTITSSVHNLYEGTQRVMSGDFAHLIDVKGHDQLAELGNSFNRMTENLQRLLKGEKERQRLQAELEIAREVQSQLHPKDLPDLGSLRLTTICTPARMVSGDYYDYQALSDTRLAVAIGDVAGKGISAALLMATLQSGMRSQLRSCLDAAEASNGAKASISTSKLVSNLNHQVYASTAPEKYATFFFGVWDEPTSTLTYTNAGHLPPYLVRNGKATAFEVNGMVVGAFPFAEYGESQIRLELNDLVVSYTDGITEPENEYGEMFGEERLIDLVVRNAHLPEAEIAALIVEAVRQWTSSEELQDDMTLLLARRVH